MMKHTAIAISFVAAAASTAAANPTFYNVTSETLTVEATFPNGSVKTAKLGDGSWINSSQTFTVGPGIAGLGIKITNDVGDQVWAGKVAANDVFVTIPAGDKTKTIFAGHYSGTSSTPKVANFINVSGVDLTIDLEGMNGLGAHRGIRPGASFEPKPLRLDPKEQYFIVTIKPKTGEPKKLSTNVQPGHYHVVTSHPREGFRIVSLGYVPPPKK